MQTKAHATVLNFNGDSNVGLYGLATDKYVLLGKNVGESQAKLIENNLNVKAFRISVYGTSLVGLFAKGNSSTLLLPSIVFENEISNLINLLKPLGVKVHVIDTEHTALGNNILMNDSIAIVSPVFSKKLVLELKKLTGLKIIQTNLADSLVPGSVGVLTNKGAIFGPNITDAEIRKLEKLLGFEIGLGTVNLGNPFVATGLFANSFGFVMGSESSGYEISRVDESLGFLANRFLKSNKSYI